MPFVPILPVLSVFINFYLMASLPTATWIRFAVWMALGLAMYFLYGIRNSSENQILHRPLRQTSISSSETSSIHSN
jgi:basic amino acid/polyamine antiporter, APA family